MIATIGFSSIDAFREDYMARVVECSTGWRLRRTHRFSRCDAVARIDGTDGALVEFRTRRIVFAERGFLLEDRSKIVHLARLAVEAHMARAVVVYGTFDGIWMTDVNLEGAAAATPEGRERVTSHATGSPLLPEHWPDVVRAGTLAEVPMSALMHLRAMEWMTRHPAPFQPAAEALAEFRAGRIPEAETFSFDPYAAADGYRAAFDRGRKQ